jgi:hypothetical protein
MEGRFAQALEVHRLLKEGVASGEVIPLPFNAFDREEVSEAFRFMAAGEALISLSHSQTSSRRNPA